MGERECYCGMSPLGVGMSVLGPPSTEPSFRAEFVRAAADKRVKKPRAAFSVQFVKFNCGLTAADDTAFRHLQLEPVYQLQQRKVQKKNCPKKAMEIVSLSIPIC